MKRQMHPGLMWRLLRLSCLLALVRASGQIKGRVSIPHKYQAGLGPGPGGPALPGGHERTGAGPRRGACDPRRRRAGHAAGLGRPLRPQRRAAGAAPAAGGAPGAQLRPRQGRGGGGERRGDEPLSQERALWGLEVRCGLPGGLRARQGSAWARISHDVRRGTEVVSIDFM